MRKRTTTDRKEEEGEEQEEISTHRGDLKRRKLIEVINEEGLEGKGAQFVKVAKKFNEQAKVKEISISKIELNDFRQVTVEGLQRLEASMKYHGEGVGGIVSNQTTKIFLCKHPSIRGKFMVCDGNHRVTYWRSKSSFI